MFLLIMHSHKKIISRNVSICVSEKILLYIKSLKFFEDINLYSNISYQIYPNPDYLTSTIYIHLSLFLFLLRNFRRNILD